MRETWEARSAKVRQFFGDRVHEFALRIGELEELDELVKEGPEVLRHKFGTRTYRVPELRETLRLGLIGAGMDKEAAATLVDRHCREGYLAECSVVAFAVANAAVYGVTEEQLGECSPAKPKTRTRKAKTPPPAASASPASTA